jgi:tRNA(Ile)-lysidine synthase
LEFVEDPSNADHRYDRGFLRGEILPRLAQRWPGYRETVGRAAQLQGQWLGERAQEPLEVVQTALGEPCLLLTDQQTPESLATATHEWLTNMGWSSPSLRRLREFARQCLESRDDRCPELSLNGAVLRCWRRMVTLSGMAFDPRIYPDTVVVGEAQSGGWGSLGWQAAGPGWGFTPGTRLGLRCRSAGEKVSVRGRKSQDFGQLCQAAGLPPWWRKQLPLFMLGGEPVFMAGLGRLGGQVSQPDSDGFCPLWLPPQPMP